jgi:hypothetical protein
MKVSRCVGFLVVCLLTGLGLSAQQQVPRLIKFSGMLRDLTGKPLTGPVDVNFAIYKEQADLVPLWHETQTLQLDEEGRYTVLLGAMQAEGLPMTLFTSGEARWLEVYVAGAEPQPRTLLVSVPYALKAGDAETLGGRRALDFVLAEQLKEKVRTQVEAQKPTSGAQSLEMLISNPPVLPAITEGPSTFTCATSGDCVGIQQSGTGFALLARAPNSTGAFGLAEGATGANYGVRGDTLSSSGVGVFGFSRASSGSTFGVRGTADSPSGVGVYGQNRASSGAAIAVRGDSTSTGGRGLQGQATAVSGTTWGVVGNALSTQGTGVLGQATASSGSTIGVAGEARSLAGVAGVFDNTAGGKLLSGRVAAVEKFSVDGSGNLVAGGSITGASGTFSGSVTATSFSGSGTLSGTQLISTVASGTAPLLVTSNTLVTNLNADLLDGVHASAFQPAGSYATLGANTFTNTQTISSGDLSVGGGDISLPQTTSASVGVINLGGNRFIHACCAADHHNTFIGVNAGNFTTTGYHNSAMGELALQSNDTGSYNNGIGNYALQYNTTGQHNAANGVAALYDNTTGSFNTGNGYGVLYYNTTSSNNTGVGFEALRENCHGVAGDCTGNNNTALGYLAGVTGTTANANVTGSNNTFIGYQSGPGTSTQLTNATAIGASALVSQSNSLILGNGAKVGIGTSTPAEPLHVASGDVYVSTAGSGVIVKSPDGNTCARIGINNSGVLSAAPVTCP